MTPANMATGYACSYQTGLLTITGFAWIPAAQVVQFTVKGINNIAAPSRAHPLAISQIRTVSDQGQLLDDSLMLNALGKQHTDNTCTQRSMF